MMRLPAAIASCTCGGAPVGIAAVPLGRILATAPGVVGPLIGAHPPLETGAQVVVPVASGGGSAARHAIGVLGHELGHLRDLRRVVVPRHERGLPVAGRPPLAQESGGGVDGVDLVVDARRLHAAGQVRRDLAHHGVPVVGRLPADPDLHRTGRAGRVGA